VNAPRVSDTLSISRFATICPSSLHDETESERLAIASCGKVDDVPARMDAVVEFIGGRQPGLVHLTGHGKVERDTLGRARNWIRLEDRLIDPERFFSKSPGGRDRLYFFSSCFQAQTSRGPAGVEGWGPAVLRSGGRGFVGGLWELALVPAESSAVYFYRALKTSRNGRPVRIAKLVQDIRRKYLTTADPTYLAYTYWGPTGLKVQVVGADRK
jgi:hypothetical protein